MKSSCIRHPEREVLSIVRQWQVIFCEGNTCAASLLSYFEYWHNVKLDQSEQQEATTSSKGTLLQWHTKAELEEGIMCARRTSIDEAIKLLEKKGAIKVFRNPNPKYKFDRTRHFRFYPEVITEWLDNIYSKIEDKYSLFTELLKGPTPMKNKTKYIDAGTDKDASKVGSLDSNSIRENSNIYHNNTPQFKISSNIGKIDKPLQVSEETLENTTSLENTSQSLEGKNRAPCNCIQFLCRLNSVDRANGCNSAISETTSKTTSEVSGELFHNSLLFLAKAKNITRKTKRPFNKDQQSLQKENTILIKESIIPSVIKESIIPSVIKESIIPSVIKRNKPLLSKNTVPPYSEENKLLLKRRIAPLFLMKTGPSLFDPTKETVAPPPTMEVIQEQPKQIGFMRNMIRNNPAALNPITPIIKSPPRMSKEVQEIVSFWELCDLPKPKRTSNTFKNGVKSLNKLLDGTMFDDVRGYEKYINKKFSLTEIKTSIKRFSIAAKDPDYEPLSTKTKSYLGKCSLDSFIFNRFLNISAPKQTSNKASNFIDLKSPFLYYLIYSPEKLNSRFQAKQLDDNHPRMSGRLQRFYIKEILGNAKVELSANDKNHFINSGNRLVEFIKNNRGKLLITNVSTEEEYCDWLCDALVKEVGGEGTDLSRIKPFWFDSDVTFSRTLPAYLYSEAILISDEVYSGYHSPTNEEDIRIDLDDEDIVFDDDYE